MQRGRRPWGETATAGGISTAGRLQLMVAQPYPFASGFTMQFWLGTHETHWLGRTEAPLFLSARRLRKVKRPRPSAGPWALDSGGFTELSTYGRYETSPHGYAAEVRRWSEQVGPPAWAAVQDWMCEPDIIAGCPKKRWPGTGLSVLEHQRRTVHSLLTLKAIAPEIPWVPVLQGWVVEDYLRHLEMYNKATLRPLSLWQLVGVGSVCRRQGTEDAVAIFQALSAQGLRLHGFGLKLEGLSRSAQYLASADSMAWSQDARRDASRTRRGLPRRRFCPAGRHDTMRSGCANCLDHALEWRGRVLARVAAERQRDLFTPEHRGGVDPAVR